VFEKSLIRSATLPSTFAAIEGSDGVAILSKVVKRWFEDDEQVKGLMLFNVEGDELLSLHRKNDHFLVADFSENHKGHLFLTDH